MGFKLLSRKICCGWVSRFSLFGYKMIALHYQERPLIHGIPTEEISRR